MTAALRTFSPSPAVGINTRAILMIVWTPQQQVLPRCQQNVTFLRVIGATRPSPQILLLCAHLVCTPINRNNAWRFISCLQILKRCKSKSTAGSFIPLCFDWEGKAKFGAGSRLTQALTCSPAILTPFLDLLFSTSRSTQLRAAGKLLSKGPPTCLLFPSSPAT